MKLKLFLAAAIAIGFASSAMADEYYVVENPTSHHCTVTTTKPAGKEVVTQIGPLAFTTREEAQNRIKTTKVCTDTVGDGDHDSSTTVIKK